VIGEKKKDTNMSTEKVTVSPIPNEWLDCGDYEDIDVLYDDSSETISETAVVGMIAQIKNDVEKGLYHEDTHHFENKIEKVKDDEPVHFLKEAQKSARLLYDPDAIVNSFEDPSVSSLDSNSAASVDSIHAEDPDFGMNWLPTSSLPYKVVIFRGQESLMKLPEDPMSPTLTTDSAKLDNCIDPFMNDQYEKGRTNTGSIRVVGLAQDDINSYVTSTTRSGTGTASGSPPSTPPNSPPRIRSTIAHGDNHSHGNHTPTHISGEVSGCFGCLKTHLAMMVDCALLVSLCLSSSILLAVVLLVVLHMM
jgi:hypothetical protein